MKIPKTRNRYCPYCKKHTKHTIERVSTAGRRSGSSLKAGSRYRIKKLEKGYGGTPYPMMEHGTRYGAKASKKVMLRFTCSVCKKAHQSTAPYRSRKFEFAK